MNGLVDSRTDELRSDNDNDATSNIQDGTLQFDGSGEIELQPGDYYLEEIVIEDNQTLVLNASRGDFNLAVRTYVVLDEGNVVITGEKDDGDVRMYLGSRESSGITVSGTGGEPADHFYVDGYSQI